MKKNKAKKNTGIIAMTVTAVLLAVLIGLAAALIMTFLATSAEVDTFDLAQVTSGRDAADIDITGYFLPEFAGITTDGERMGVCSSANTVGELFRLVSPAIAEMLTAEHLAGGITEEEWIALAEEENSVYLRFHERTPLSVLALFAGLYSGNDSVNAPSGYAVEMLILPYSESFEHRNGIMRIAVRDSDGSASFYIKVQPGSVLTAEELAQTAASYQSSLRTFVFAGDDYPASSPTEPVFMSSVAFRNIIAIGGTGATIAENDGEAESLLRVFDINPDKLLSTHTEPDGSRSYIDTQGILYIRESEFEYRSTSDGGIHLSDLTAAEWGSTLQNYISASVEVWNRIRDINRMYTGDEADLELSSVSSKDGTVTVTFAYAVDNLRIMTEKPAFTAVFEDGILRSATVFTIAVWNLGTRGQSANEWWFYDTLDGVTPMNVTLVYRANYASVYSVDYDADSLAAEWAAVTEIPDDERRGR